MARAQTATLTLAAANAAGVAASQTPGAAGALTLTASPVVLDVPRRVLATTTGAETGKTLTLTGTDRAGAVISEVLALPSSSTVQSLQDFATVSAAVISAAAAAALTVGTSAVASTRWIKVNPHATPFSASLAAFFGGGTGTVQFEVTLDESDSVTGATPIPGGNLVWSAPVAFAAPSQAALTTDGLQVLAQPVVAVRLTSTVRPTTSIRAVVLQAGLT